MASAGESLAFRENPALDKALGLYRSIEDDYVRSIEATGVKFALRDEKRAEAQDLRARLEKAGARIRNGGASVSVGFLSRGCVACTGSCVSCTFAISNNCHRDCFFCFNPNEKDFAYYCEHQFPWREKLEGLAHEGSTPVCLALSGGEPMLYPDEACAYFECARNLFPGVHTRLYTSGDLLNAALLDRLRDAGLDEIRFSVKQSDEPEEQEKLFAIMELALERIPTVMVEMPPIPGTEASMRTLLKRLDALGVHGINLLEFAYAMWNWEVFDSLGLTLRNPPNRVCYDYTYVPAPYALGDRRGPDARHALLFFGEQASRAGAQYRRAVCGPGRPLCFRLRRLFLEDGHGVRPRSSSGARCAARAGMH